MSTQNANRSSGEGNCTNPTSASAPEKIMEALESLQRRSIGVNRLYLKSREALNKHLVDSYLWWRDAKEIPGFIEAEYGKLNLRKSSGQMTPNFIPALRIICGPNCNLDDRDFQRRSRALNALHMEYERNSSKYRKDTAKKLVAYIVSEGGVVALAESVKPERDSEEAKSKSKSRKDRAKENQNAADALLGKAKSAIEATEDGPSCAGDELPGYVSTNEEQLFAVLMKVTDEGRKIVSKSNDPAIIESLLIDSYRSRFDINKTAIRPLLELLQTQCLPQHLGKLSKRLMDSSEIKGLPKELRMSARRVMYLHETQQFLLSPIRAESGVVSLVKPNEVMLSNCVQDVFMPPHQTRSLESKLLRNFDFNLYTSSDIRDYPDSSDSADPSHTMSLVHFADAGNRFPIHFWPFYDSFPQPMDQVMLSSEYCFGAQWTQGQSHDWFQKLSDEFLDPWLIGRGSHLCRDEESIVEVIFDTTAIEVRFFAPKSGLDVEAPSEFHGSETIELDTGAICCGPTTLRFLAKDWIVTMRSIARLPVARGVNFSVNTDVCRLEFDTADPGGAEHEIYIPTVDEKGNRCTVPFARYAPEPVKDTDLDFLEVGEGWEPYEEEKAQLEGVLQ